VRLPSERVRVLVCSAAGAVALFVSTLWGPWQLAVLIGWAVTAAALIGWIWLDIWGLDAATTRRVSTREDASRAAMLLLVLGASVISLAAVVVGLHRASSASTRLEVGLSVGAMLTVVLSWSLVHTLFTLRYAHLYYGSHGASGIELAEGEPPCYADFAYVAFTIGMTYQVSDTQVTSAAIRGTVLRHALLSYVFGTAIIASSISVLSGLVV
jgi:uncharacterized membrane protein